jgi:hypothetical protein
MEKIMIRVPCDECRCPLTCTDFMWCVLQPQDPPKMLQSDVVEPDPLGEFDG